VNLGLGTNDRYATLSVGTSVAKWCHCEERPSAVCWVERVLSIRVPVLLIHPAN